MKKWENFLGRAMVGNLGDQVKGAVMAIPAGRNDMEIVIKSAIEFGELADEEIVKKYGPARFS